MENIKLGTRQKSLIEALRSTKYKQAKEVMCNGRNCFCVVGLILFLSGDFKTHSVGKQNKFELVHKKNKKTRYNIFDDDDGSYFNLTDKALFDLINLNDAAGKSFKEIALELETNPNEYFSDTI